MTIQCAAAWKDAARQAPMKNEPAVVVLAAGAGTRYQGTRHKLSEQLGGDSVLVRTLRNAIASEMSVVLVVSEALVPEASTITVGAGDRGVEGVFMPRSISASHAQQ